MPSHTASFKDRVEYGGVLILEGLFRFLPYRFCVGLAWMIARFAFHVLRWRRREAERRIRSVLGVGASEARKIAWQSLRNSALTAGEILYGRAVRDSWIHRHVDGWEESLDPDSLATLKPDELIELNIVPEDVRKNDASEGDALYKLVTNDTWYMVLSVPKEKREAYSLNSNVTVIFDKGSVRAKVSESYDRGDYAMIILKTGRYFEYFAQLRTQDVKVITSDYTGLLLPVTAVTQQDEENGVYVLGIDGNYSFVPVEILTQSGDTILVSADGDLRIYDTVMRNVTEDQEE